MCVCVTHSNKQVLKHTRTHTQHHTHTKGKLLADPHLVFVNGGSSPRARHAEAASHRAHTPSRGGEGGAERSIGSSPRAHQTSRHEACQPLHTRPATQLKPRSALGSRRPHSSGSILAPRQEGCCSSSLQPKRSCHCNRAWSEALGSPGTCPVHRLSCMKRRLTWVLEINSLIKT